MWGRIETEFWDSRFMVVCFVHLWGDLVFCVSKGLGGGYRLGVRTGFCHVRRSGGWGTYGGLRVREGQSGSTSASVSGGRDNG